MIINLKKYLLFGVEKEINHFFEKAQKQGFIEFISKERSKKVGSEEVLTLVNAIKILKKIPGVDLKTASTEKIDFEKVARSVLENQQLSHNLTEELRYLSKEKEKIKPLGDFSLEDLNFIKESCGYKMQFFCQKTKKQREKNNIPEELIYLSTEYDLDYFVSISKEKKSFLSFIEIKIDKSLSDIKSRIEEIKKQLHVLEGKQRSSAKYTANLQHALKEHLNTLHLEEAKDSVLYPSNQPIFMVEAWIPEDRLDQLNRILEHHNIAYQEIKIEKKDRIPTCFENKGYSRVGEDLVCVYDIPDSTDKDPSTWVLFSFAIFFAIIIADAGYGLVYLAIFLLLKFTLKQKTSALKRLTKLTGLLSFTCITWGILTASFFGMNISPNAPFRKYSAIQYLADKKASYHLRVKDDVYDDWVKKYPEVKDTTDVDTFFDKTMKIKDGRPDFEALGTFYDNILLEISLLIGVFHISFSFFRYLRRSWAGIGWVIFMIGGYLYFPHSVGATSMLHYLNIIDKQTAFAIGPTILFSGIGLAVVLALIQERLRGFGEIINVIQVFADVLSYLRLYALGLSGMIMASTFNMLASKASIIFAIPMLLIGHFVTILLGLMSGVIHGLRLNFIEWYHWSFTGEGKKFNPLKKL